MVHKLPKQEIATCATCGRKAATRLLPADRVSGTLFQLDTSMTCCSHPNYWTVL